MLFSAQEILSAAEERETFRFAREETKLPIVHLAHGGKILVQLL